MSLYTYSNPVFAGYAFYACLLIFKMLAMSLLTAYQRMRKKEQLMTRLGRLALWLNAFNFSTSSFVMIGGAVALVGRLLCKNRSTIIAPAFVNAEDATMAEAEVKLVPDEDVERLRRAHLNDLENIPAFLISGLLFVGTDPNVIFAMMMFRIFTLGRFMHTIVYAVYIVRQPARTISFNLGLLVNIIVLVSVLVNCFQF